VGVEDDVTRLLDYGHVSVRTYVGKNTVPHVRIQYKRLDMVKSNGRVPSIRLRMKRSDAQCFASKDGVTVETQPDQPPKTDVQTSPLSTGVPFLKVIGANCSSPAGNGGTVTYRNIVLLWQQSGSPHCLYPARLGILARLITLVRTPGEPCYFNEWLQVDTVVIALPVVMILSSSGGSINTSIGVTIFQVTPDRSGYRQEAVWFGRMPCSPLENILSTQAHRYGLGVIS